MEKYLIADFGADDYGREPIIKKFKNGVMICLFLSGGKTEPEIANVVKISRSFDDGKTWTKPETLFSLKERGCWCPEIFSDEDVTFCCVNTYSGTWRREYYRELQTYRSFTEDGINFTEPVSFPCGLNGVSLRQGIKMSNGEWLFPMYWSEVTYDFEYTVDSGKIYGEDRFPFRCGFAISSDKGNTFARYGYLKADRSLWEPACAEFEDGRIICLMRYNGAPILYMSESFDFGRTWSNPCATDIPNANTKIVMFKIGKQVYLVNNFCNETGMWNRKRLQIRKIYSDLRTELIYSPEPEDEVWFYPHVIVDNDNKKLYLAYENKRKHRMQIINFDKLI